MHVFCLGRRRRVRIRTSGTGCAAKRIHPRARGKRTDESRKNADAKPEKLMATRSALDADEEKHRRAQPCSRTREIIFCSLMHRLSMRTRMREKEGQEQTIVSPCSLDFSFIDYLPCRRLIADERADTYHRDVAFTNASDLVVHLFHAFARHEREVDRTNTRQN